MQKDTENWFVSWFDTPYYHILYKERDDDEAGVFMKNLTNFLSLSKNAEILDLACGKGRHARYLNKMGFNVTGIDLSPSSIAHAKQFEKEGLQFKVHDMCLPFPKKFDAVFNLFTSFGYFENEQDNLRTIKAIKAELKSNGLGVIDFMNASFVKNNLVPSETKTIEGISFTIKRSIKDGYIIKEIYFENNNEAFNYIEKVKAISLSDFKAYFKKAGVELLYQFGDYQLNPFDEETSNRLILIFR